MKKNLLLLGVSLSIAFAIGEIICRSKGYYLSYNERTGVSGYTSPFAQDDRGWTHRYHPGERIDIKRNEFTEFWIANKHGLKGQPPEEKKQAPRILIVGDSYAEGMGAPEDSSYPVILQSLLDTSAKIINAGVAGSDIFFEYKLLQALNTTYRPDVVLVTCNPSDIPECLTRGGFERFNPNGEVEYCNAPWFEPLYAHSLLVRLIVHNVFNYDFNFIPKQKYAYRLANAEAAMCTAIDSFAIYCHTNHLKLGFVFHPFQTDFLNPELYLMQKLIAHCKKNNIPYIDEFEYLQQQGITPKNATTIYWPSDGHFNAIGYAMLAQCANRFFKKQVWLPTTY